LVCHQHSKWTSRPFQQ